MGDSRLDLWFKGGHNSANGTAGARLRLFVG